MTNPRQSSTDRPGPRKARGTVARISSEVLSAVRTRPQNDDPTAPTILEYQWPSTAIVNTPIPRGARNVAWIVSSMFFVMIALMGVIPVDQVVTARGIVVSKMATILAQPLDTAIVRSIDVREGEFVRSGQLLARFDPTFAAADLHSLATQVASLKAEVTRLQAQAQGTPYVVTITSDGDTASVLQAANYSHEEAEFRLKSKSYDQKIDELRAMIARADADVQAFTGRLAAASEIEKMRKQLEAEQFGSRLNTLLATDTRIEMQRSLTNAQQSAQAARRDLAGMQAERDAFIQGWSAAVGQRLSDARRKLAESAGLLEKAQRHKDLMELRADRDAIVQSIAKVSVGSVLQTGERFITLVPADAKLEIEANVSGRDSGFVQVGNRVSIKFDTLPFSQYGTAEGTVRMISPSSFTAQEEVRNPTSALPLPPTSEPYYRARVTVDREALRGVPPDFRVIPGMPVSADIKVGKRTVLSYLFGRVMPYAQEGMREP